jgi:hypothetical protein
MDGTAMPELHSKDRRSHNRYPITLQLQYKLGTGRVRLGFGQTINISSRGVLFEVEEELPNGGKIELALNWPFLLQGSCGLKLVMRGRIVRRERNRIALKAQFHEFRTVGRSVFEGPAN